MMQSYPPDGDLGLSSQCLGQCYLAVRGWWGESPEWQWGGVSKVAPLVPGPLGGSSYLAKTSPVLPDIQTPTSSRSALSLTPSPW